MSPAKHSKTKLLSEVFELFGGLPENIVVRLEEQIAGRILPLCASGWYNVYYMTVKGSNLGRKIKSRLSSKILDEEFVRY